MSHTDYFRYFAIKKDVCFAANAFMLFLKICYRSFLLRYYYSALAVSASTMASASVSASKLSW